MKKEDNYKWKLGMFVTIGLVLSIGTIYLIGKQRNMFGATFRLQTIFRNVSGLQEGNNVRFDGINVGTVDNIQLLTDTSVKVEMIIEKDVQRFIKKDATATIGSDGLMGDKVLVIGAGALSQMPIEENNCLNSIAPIETEQIMESVKSTVDNAKIITQQIALFSYKMNNNNGVLNKLIGDEAFATDLKNTMANLQTSSDQFAAFTTKMNDGHGALSKMVGDQKFAQSLDSTMSNLQSGTKSLSENMEAAKHNILLRGYFKKQKRLQDEKNRNSIQDTIIINNK